MTENIYTNDYLNKQLVGWNRSFTEAGGKTGLPRQLDFYSRCVRTARERTVVIISDALRYEVGRTLFERLQADEKCTAMLSAMQAVLPSYTRFGMAALLPHKRIELCPDLRVTVDGKPTDDLKQREAVLQAVQPNSRCLRFDDIRSMKVAELREIFEAQYELTLTEEVEIRYRTETRTGTTLPPIRKPGKPLPRNMSTRWKSPMSITS